jgi:hypothetical protein
MKAKAMKMIVASLAIVGFGIAQADVSLVGGNLNAMSQCTVCNAGFVGDIYGAAGTAGYRGATQANVNGYLDGNASAWSTQVVGTMRAASMAEIGHHTASVTNSSGTFSGVSVVGGTGYSSSSAGSGGQAISWR